MHQQTLGPLLKKWGQFSNPFMWEIQKKQLANQDTPWQTTVNAVLIDEPQGFCETIISHSNRSAFCTHEWRTTINAYFHYILPRNCAQSFNPIGSFSSMPWWYARKRPDRVETLSALAWRNILEINIDSSQPFRSTNGIQCTGEKEQHDLNLGLEFMKTWTFSVATEL